MQNKIVINSEEEALEYLKSVDNSLMTYGAILDWDDWHLRITGKDYEGTIDFHLLKLLLELQNSIYKLYAYLCYNSTDVRKLTQEDKNRLKLKISVKSGSTDINMILADIIKQIVSIMTPEYTFYCITLAILLFFGHKFFQTCIDYKVKNKEIDNYATQQSVLKDVMQNYNNLVATLSDNENLKIQAIAQMAQERDFNALKCFKNTNANSIEYQKEKFDLDKIKDVLKNDKIIKETKSIRLDGIYQVLAVDYKNESYTELELLPLEVENLKNKQTITAFYNTEETEKNESLSFGLIEKRKFYIEINGKMLNEILEEATIVSIKER